VGKTGFEDPGAVVIDEVAGQWLVLAVAPLDVWYFAAAFVLFRVFDIAKPWPVSWADRRIKGGFGVMFDDILAGLYGAAVLLVVLWLVEGSHVL
jgi:phosphatidylglycerophosphatase A